MFLFLVYDAFVCSVCECVCADKVCGPVCVCGLCAILRVYMERSDNLWELISLSTTWVLKTGLRPSGWQQASLPVELSHQPQLG